MKKLFIISASALISIAIFAADNDNDKRQVSCLDHNSSKLRATFEAIQDIHRLAAETPKDVEADGGGELQLGVEGWPGSYPDQNQTKQGLFLVCSNSLPQYLATPLGKVSIFGKVISHFRYDASKLPKIFDAFREMLRLSFVGIEGEYVQGRKFFVLDKNGAINEIITKEKLLGLYGSDERVVDNCSSGYAFIYKILAIGNTPLPNPIEADSEDYRKYKTVKESWNKLMEQHKKEIRVLKAIEDAKK